MKCCQERLSVALLFRPLLFQIAIIIPRAKIVFVKENTTLFSKRVLYLPWPFLFPFLPLTCLLPPSLYPFWILDWRISIICPILLVSNFHSQIVSTFAPAIPMQVDIVPTLAWHEWLVDCVESFEFLLSTIANLPSWHLPVQVGCVAHAMAFEFLP